MKRQRGFSLIEALIALLVLSFGLMGVAAMQVKALQSATAGYQRSVATLAAVDAQERLWAELAGLEDTEDCSNIKDELNKTDNTGVEDKWLGYWFGVSSSTPIQNFTGEIHDESSSEYNLEACEFLIEINLDENPGGISADVFTYTFRLPKM